MRERENPGMAAHACNPNTWKTEWLQLKFRASLGWMRETISKSKSKYIHLGVGAHTLNPST